MDGVAEDVANLCRYFLSWVPAEAIEQFLRQVPPHQSRLRSAMCLQHFYKQKDNKNKDMRLSIEDDAYKIMRVLTDVSYTEIKNKLLIFGNVFDRREATVRELINERYHLHTNLDVPTKRKSDINEQDETIKIKIKRKDGGLQVVSTFDRRRNTIGANDQVMQHHPIPFVASAGNMEPRLAVISSPASSPSSKSTASSGPKSISRSSTPPPEYRIFNEPKNNNPFLFPGTAEPKKRMGYLEVPQLSKAPLTLNARFSAASAAPSTSRHRGFDRVAELSGTDADASETFNLVTYLQYTTRAPGKRIRTLIKMMDLDVNKKPTQTDLDFIMKYLAKKSVIRIVSSSESSSSDSEDGVDGDPSPVLIPPIPRTNKRKVPEATITKEIPSEAKESPPHEPKIKPDIVDIRGEELIHSATPNIEPQEPSIVTELADALEDYDDEDEDEEMYTYYDITNSSTSGEKVADWLGAGPSTGINRNVDEQLVRKIIEIFPDACPDYVRGLCENKVYSELELTQIVTMRLLGNDYPKRAGRPESPPKELDPEEQFENLKEILPDADPTYLRRKCDEFAGNVEEMKVFIADAFENQDYPTMKEYLRKQQLSSQQRQYTTEFKVEDFVQLFPDPKATFTDPKRKVKMDKESLHYVSIFMRNKFDMIPAKQVDDVVCAMKDVRSCMKALHKEQKSGMKLKTRRRKCFLPDNMQNIPLLQELAYYSHRKEISKYIRQKAEREQEEKQQAIANGEIESCGCCFDEEVMTRDTFTCDKGCKFCRDCIKRSVEIAMGEGRTNILCLGLCEASFGLHTLQQVLPPKVFSKLAQKKAVAELKASGIEELENCPFCDFAIIPAPEDKLFRCLNPDCMKESCRLCKEPSHVPLKCEEVEVDEAVKARTYIENKLTEALLRKCYKCGTKFFKEEGCNKMTCSCGAMMCYLCQQPVTDYKHFNGIGGDQTHLCPLYSDNIAVNEECVLKAAESAKAEVDVSKLKHDPTTDLQEHFKERKKAIPQPHLEALQGAAAAPPVFNMEDDLNIVIPRPPRPYNPPLFPPMAPVMQPPPAHQGGMIAGVNRMADRARLFADLGIPVDQPPVLGPQPQGQVPPNLNLLIPPRPPMDAVTVLRRIEREYERERRGPQPQAQVLPNLNLLQPPPMDAVTVLRRRIEREYERDRRGQQPQGQVPPNPNLLIPPPPRMDAAAVARVLMRLEQQYGRERRVPEPQAQAPPNLNVFIPPPIDPVEPFPEWFARVRRQELFHPEPEQQQPEGQEQEVNQDRPEEQIHVPHEPRDDLDFIW